MVLLMSGLALAPLAAAQERTTDPLGPLAQCIGNDKFHFEKIDRLPPKAISRPVRTAASVAYVSTVDGYRMLVRHQSSAPLVNLKLERSADGRFAADRDVIVAQMTELSARTEPAHHVELEQHTQNGIEILALNNSSIQHAPGVISFYTLLDAHSATIATAYILNQPAQIREFSTDEEYAALRDAFIDLVRRCMSR